MDRNNTKYRISYIDFLKTIGLICIILAHLKTPSWILILRSFDVQLMVILSGLLANQSSIVNSYTYIFKRIKRLVIPTYIFLTVWFICLSLLGKIYNYKYYLASYALSRYGIGYVWIILIYLYISNTSIQKNKQ